MGAGGIDQKLEPKAWSYVTKCVHVCLYLHMCMAVHMHVCMQRKYHTRQCVPPNIYISSVYLCKRQMMDKAVSVPGPRMVEQHFALHFGQPLKSELSELFATNATAKPACWMDCYNVKKLHRNSNSQVVKLSVKPLKCKGVKPGDRCKAPTKPLAL